MSTYQSVETALLHAVIEEDLTGARESLRTLFLDGELMEFYDAVSKTLDLVREEMGDRGIRT